MQNSSVNDSSMPFVLSSCIAINYLESNRQIVSVYENARETEISRHCRLSYPVPQTSVCPHNNTYAYKIEWVKETHV